MKSKFLVNNECCIDLEHVSAFKLIKGGWNSIVNISRNRSIATHVGNSHWRTWLCHVVKFVFNTHPVHSKFTTWQMYKWWRGWTGSSLKSTSWQGLTSTDLLQIITTGYERFWLVRPSVRPSGIVVFRKCNSSRTAAQNSVNTLYLEYSL